MNNNDSIHTIFSNIVNTWSEKFKNDMEPLIKLIDNINMKNSVINEILKSMPEYKLLEETNQKLINENLELKNKLDNHNLNELTLSINEYKKSDNNNISCDNNCNNIIISKNKEETKKEVKVEETEEEVEETEEEVEETEEEVEEREEEVEETEEEVEETEEEAEETEEEVEETEEEAEKAEEEVEEAEEEVEEEVEETEEDDEEEVFLVEIQGKNYYTNSEKNGIIYECLDDEDIGDEVGKFDKNGIAIFQ